MKTFIGPRLRRLREENRQTQSQMAQVLGVSTSYVNLLEKNQRSVSVSVLLRLLENYGVEWRDIAEDDDTALLSDVRSVLQDPLFNKKGPDLTQLRAALTHSPDLARCFVQLHHAYLSATDQLQSVAGMGERGDSILPPSPEATVHDFFRKNQNYFHDLERAADAFWQQGAISPDDVYAAVKARLLTTLGLNVRLMPVAEMPGTLREYDEGLREIRLSEALDHTNRVFQLVHVSCLIEHAALLDDVLSRSGLDDAHGRARCRVELANYFAAAVLMPYDRFRTEAMASKYDFDYLATRFGVSFEQTCHRATTLQRDGAKGVPFFFLRVDAAGNVTKRFNSTDFHLAEYGGACPRLELHASFNTPGRIVPQRVVMPDASQFFVLSRTVGRPSFTRFNQDVRLAVAIGCSVDHISDIGYADDLTVTEAYATPIGINCRICPRVDCDQRAHQTIVVSNPVDERKRGATRYSN